MPRLRYKRSSCRCGQLCSICARKNIDIICVPSNENTVICDGNKKLSDSEFQNLRSQKSQQSFMYKCSCLGKMYYMDTGVQTIRVPKKKCKDIYNTTVSPSIIKKIPAEGFLERNIPINSHVIYEYRDPCVVCKRRLRNRLPNRYNNKDKFTRKKIVIKRHARTRTKSGNKKIQVERKPQRKRVFYYNNGENYFCECGKISYKYGPKMKSKISECKIDTCNNLRCSITQTDVQKPRCVKHRYKDYAECRGETREYTQNMAMQKLPEIEDHLINSCTSDQALPRHKVMDLSNCYGEKLNKISDHYDVDVRTPTLCTELCRPVLEIKLDKNRIKAINPHGISRGYDILKNEDEDAELKPKDIVFKPAIEKPKSKILLYISEVCNRDKCNYRTRRCINTDQIHKPRISSLHQNLLTYISENKIKNEPSVYSSFKNKTFIPNGLNERERPQQSLKTASCKKCPYDSQKKSTKEDRATLSSNCSLCQSCPLINRNKCVNKINSENQTRRTQNYHSRQGLNTKKFKNYFISHFIQKVCTQIRSRGRCKCVQVTSKKNKKHERELKKKRLKEKARKEKIEKAHRKKKNRRDKVIERKEKKETKIGVKQFKKEKIKLKREAKEVAKVDETHDTHCRADFLVGTFTLTVQTLKALFKMVLKLATEPKESYEYVRTRLKYRKATIDRLSRWWTIAWQRQKLRMTRSIKGSRNMTILTDELLETPLYKAFADHGKTKKERRLLEIESRKRKYRIAQKRKKALCSGNVLLLSLRKRPCLWVHHINPSFYPIWLKFLTLFKNMSDVMLFFLALLVWTPCIVAVELCRVCMCCCMCR